jgi:hypothetical protein
MKSAVEHVDEFIDGFLNGNIVSMFQKGVIRPFMREETVANQLAQMKATLFNELIPPKKVNSDMSGIGEVLIVQTEDGTLYRMRPIISDDRIQPPKNRSSDGEEYRTEKSMI